MSDVQALEVVEDLNNSVAALGTELKRFASNIEKLGEQHEMTANICEILVAWMEKSAVMKQLLEKQILPVTEAKDT